MRQHGRDNIGVMNLTTRERIGSAQPEELIPDRGTIFEYRETPRECRSIRNRLGQGESLSPRLRSRHCRDILAQDLSAERKRLTDRQPSESDPSSVAKRPVLAVA
jgi:hypothetical protein